MRARRRGNLSLVRVVKIEVSSQAGAAPVPTEHARAARAWANTGITRVLCSGRRRWGSMEPLLKGQTARLADANVRDDNAIQRTFVTWVYGNVSKGRRNALKEAELRMPGSQACEKCSQVRIDLRARPRNQFKWSFTRTLSIQLRASVLWHGIRPLGRGGRSTATTGPRHSTTYPATFTTWSTPPCSPPRSTPHATLCHAPHRASAALS